jgi:hypothetical protein
MRSLLPVLMLVIIAFACSENRVQDAESTCSIRFDSLIKNLDTSKFDVFYWSESDSFGMADKGLEKLGGSLFFFNPEGQLCTYTFIDKWPNSIFMIEFDSVGRKLRLQDHEVVLWRFEPWRADSIIRLKVFLCAVDRNYGDIVIRSGSFSASNIQLFETSFTKLIGFKVEIPKLSLGKDKLIYLAGRRSEKCSGYIDEFSDSVYVPDLNSSAQHRLAKSLGTLN